MNKLVREHCKPRNALICYTKHFQCGWEWTARTLGTCYLNSCEPEESRVALNQHDTFIYSVSRDPMERLIAALHEGNTQGFWSGKVDLQGLTRAIDKIKKEGFWDEHLKCAPHVSMRHTPHVWYVRPGLTSC